MNPTTASSLRLVGAFIATFIIGLPALWGGFALWYQLPGGSVQRGAGVVVWLVFSLTTLTLLWQGRTALGVVAFALAFVGLFVWWTRVPPSNNHDWADDVAQITHGSVDGSHVTLHNVRNFDWRTATDYTPRWESRTYDLEALQSVDMIMSYWSSPAIAHMLISFGFRDGTHVVFSVEIRRQKTQAFSEIGGFFKEFELSIIAADERDVIRLRTNVRREDDYLYRLQLPPDAMRLLFLGYLDEANRLVDQPRFYNTITVNCTTLVYHMMKRIVGHLPLDYRLLFSGYLPEYVYGVGGLDRRFSLAELRAGGRIGPRALASDRSDTFSADIRRGVPGIGDNNGVPPAARTLPAPSTVP